MTDPVVYKLSASGIAYSMKNRRKLWMVGRRRKLVLSDEAQAAFEGFVAQFRSQWALAGRSGSPLIGPLILTLELYYPNALHDGGDELVKDALQRSGVVKNDNQFQTVSYTKRIDKTRPRVEAYIIPIT